MKELKAFPGETFSRLEVFRPHISFSWKELSFQALSLDFMCLLPSFALESIPEGWGGTDLLHACRKFPFPTDVKCC